MAEKAILSVSMRHQQGSLRLHMDFTLQAPWTVLFGPSGSGKSTILRVIAGFIRPRECDLVFGQLDRVLARTMEGVFVPAHLRPVRTAGQTARLFPGMRVIENVAYGVGWNSRSGDHVSDVHEVLGEILALFRLKIVADRRPAELSGGERQRVSVARAVASAVTFDDPGGALLLLDEPFSGLDTALRDELAMGLRGFLAHWRVPVLSVSHDVAEAFLLGADVIRIADGQVADQGPAEIVLAGERERILAGLRG